MAVIPHGLGWQRDNPDPRDLTIYDDQVQVKLHDLSPIGSLPDRVDLREFCTPVEDQGKLASSSANACVALLSYFERRAHGEVIEPSILFVYKCARRLRNQLGNCGIDLRTTWKAIFRFGVPPESSWPHDESRIDDEPDAYAFTFGNQFQSPRYVRFDVRGAASESTLDAVKSHLAAGFPCVFGFCVCRSQSDDAGIHFPTIYDGIRGGQAVVAVGYDDNVRVSSERGSLLIRTSWGTDWGEEGYGWLPYRYIQEHLAADFWTAMRDDWLESGEFNRPW